MTDAFSVLIDILHVLLLDVAQSKASIIYSRSETSERSSPPAGRALARTTDHHKFKSEHGPYHILKMEEREIAVVR